MDREKNTRQPIIGILGGIASGKSTVAAEFAKLGCKVIDADRIAHRLLAEPQCKERLVSAFGGEILDKEGRISKSALAKAAFRDSKRAKLLNGILHPPVLARTERLIGRFRRRPDIPAIILDMPLLLEAGFSRRCDRIVFVDCRRQLRLQRAKKTGLMDEKQLENRENFQISLDRKAAAADNTIDNNSDFSALARQVAAIFTLLRNKE